MAPPGGGASEKDLRESSKVDLVTILNRDMYYTSWEGVPSNIHPLKC